MANSSFETQLDVLNKNLKVDGVGKVYISRKAFYLKAYLPDKFKPNWDELKQRWVATGLKAEKFILGYPLEEYFYLQILYK